MPKDDDRLKDALARVAKLEAAVDWLRLEVRQLSLMSGCYVVPVVPTDDGHLMIEDPYDMEPDDDA